MEQLADSTQRYFAAISAALTGLKAVARLHAGQPGGDGLVLDALSGHAENLKGSFESWQRQCLFADRFRIDLEESGFPLFQHVMDLEDASNRRMELLLDKLQPDEIREQMIDQLLRHRQFPVALQRQMAERLYLDGLDGYRQFQAFSEPEALRIALNPRTERPYYVMHWASYDGTANLPLVYFAMVEDSSDTAARVPKAGASGHRKDAFGQSPFGGLPNYHLREAFRTFARNHSAYSLNLTSIATAMDKDFADLHPKQLRRFILGPFYAGGITRHNETVQDVLDEVSDPADAWLLTWTMQELYSKQEVPAKSGLWSTSPAREMFFVDTNDVDCAAQGVSNIERYALIPHNAYQAAYAKGIAQTIFDGYQCYIASGEHILQHV